MHELYGHVTSPTFSVRGQAVQAAFTTTSASQETDLLATSPLAISPQLQRQQAGRTRCARMADDKAMDAETEPDTGNERATPMDSSPQPSAEVSSPVHRGTEAAHKPSPASVQRPAHQQPPPHLGSGRGGTSHASVKLSTGAGTGVGSLHSPAACRQHGLLPMSCR